MASLSRPWMEDWEDLDRIGDGGQGEVFKLRHRSDASRFAVVKTLASRWLGNLEAIGRLELEIQTLQKLSKCGAKVPKVFESHLDHMQRGVADAEPYILMEFIHGERFHEWLTSNSPTTIEAAYTLVSGLLETIRYCHAQNVGHRDIKPKNIILKNGSILDPYLLDFGISFDSQQTVALTIRGEVFWNEFIMLPECTDQIGGHRDLRSDITALAGVFFRCITGHSPNVLLDGNGQTPQVRHQDKLRKVCVSTMQFSSLMWLFNRAFAYKPSDRHGSLEEFEKAMQEVLANSEESPLDLLAEARQLAIEVKATEPAAIRAARRARRDQAIEAMEGALKAVTKNFSAAGVPTGVAKRDASKDAVLRASIRELGLSLDKGNNALSVQLTFPPSTDLAIAELILAERPQSFEFHVRAASAVQGAAPNLSQATWKKVAEIASDGELTKEDRGIITSQVQRVLFAEVRNLRAMRTAKN